MSPPPPPPEPAAAPAASTVQVAREAPELPPEAQATPEETALLKHLMFHKALLGEAGDPDRVNQYIAMVKASREGAHLVMVNPFDRAIAIAFQLVMEKHLDPWKLDLVQFTAMYMDHVRKGGEVDLITAGRLIFMAWAVLKLQSDEALLHAEASRQQPQEPEPEVSWDDIRSDAWLTDDGSYAFTSAVLQRKQPPIDEKVRHRGDRKVTLYELVEAFEEARREAESRIVLDTKRREARRLWQEQSRTNVHGAAHKDDLEAEIREVWGRILKLNGHPIPLRSLHADSREDLVKALVSCLFLARESHVDIWQENFPYGPIYVKNRHPGVTPAELELRPQARPAMEPGAARVAAKRARKRDAPAARARRTRNAKSAIADMPIEAQLEVAARMANLLAKMLPDEVTRA